LSFDTPGATDTTTPTPSVPPTAGTGGRMGYTPAQLKHHLTHSLPKCACKFQCEFRNSTWRANEDTKLRMKVVLEVLGLQGFALEVLGF